MTPLAADNNTKRIAIGYYSSHDLLIHRVYQTDSVSPVMWNG